nr:MAG TPA: hypothetical protein [Caudoviricetes sp.]
MNKLEFNKRVQQNSQRKIAMTQKCFMLKINIL